MEANLIGIIAGIVSFLAIVPYILDTLNRKAKPNKATWIIWAVVGIIIAASYWQAAAHESAWVIIANAVGVTIVMLLALKYGVEGWTSLDKACLLGAGCGLLLWWATSEPALALYLTTIVDIIGSLPTIKKAYERPETESRASWLVFLTANTLNLFAITEWTLATAMYPIYVFTLSAIMSALLARKRSGKR
jgi:hypothetical protein